jgi:hypothetical protein
MRLKSFTYLLACLTGCTVGRAAHAAESSVDLSVETGSPDALCPDLSATRRAVHDRIGQLALEGEQRWVARYTIGHAPSGGGDYVQLVLKDGTETVRLERRLPLAGESCDTVVQAIALVLERYFRELQAPSAQPEPEVAVDDRPVAVQPASQSPAQPPERIEAALLVRPLAPPLQIAAKGGFAAGPNTGVVGVELGLWFARWFQASLEPQLLVPQIAETVRDQTGLDRGTAQLLEVPLRATVGLGIRSAKLGVHVGPALRVSIRRAETRGLQLTEGAGTRSGDASAVGLTTAVGATAGATWWLSAVWGLTASLAVDAKVSETRFRVNAGSGAQTVLASPSAEAQLLVGVAFGVKP